MSITNGAKLYLVHDSSAQSGTSAAHEDRLDDSDKTTSAIDEFSYQIKQYCLTLLLNIYQENTETFESQEGEVKKISMSALRGGISFIENFTDDILIPEISDDLNGCFYFEWYKNPDCFVGVNICSDNVIYFSAIYGDDDQDMGIKPNNMKGIDKLRELLKKVNFSKK